MNNKKSYQLTDLIVIFFSFIGLQLTIGWGLHTILSQLDLSWLQVSLANCLIFGGLIYWQLTVKQLPINSYFTKPALSLPPVVGVLVASLGLSIILSEANNIIQCFFPLSEQIVNRINELIALKNNFFFPGLLATAVAAGIKEIFFRGLILQGLAAEYSLKKAAGFTILLQLIFEFSIYHFLSIFTLSLLLNWLYLHSKSLALCLLGNISYAVLPYFFLYYLPYQIPGYNTKLSTTVQFQPFWFNLLGILLLSSGAFLIINSFQLNQKLDSK